jgi:hypothetical protein
VREILNSKHEIPAFAEAAPRRQAKLETSTNSQNPNDPNEKVLNLDNWKFEFISSFDIRISDLAKGH